MNDYHDYVGRSAVEDRKWTVDSSLQMEGDRPVPATGSDRSHSIAVVEAIADAEGVDTDALGPLFDSIDPYVIEQFVATARTEGTLTFHFAGYVVSVDSDGGIAIRSLDGEGRSTGAYERELN